MNDNFLEFVEGWPKTLRYILSLPSFVLGYIIGHLCIKFARYVVTNDETSLYYIIVEYAIEAISFYVGLLFFYSMMPKYKVKSTLILSALIIIIGFMSLGITIMSMNEYTSSQFWKYIIGIVLDIFIAPRFIIV